MSELEDRLGRALAEGTRGAPGVAGLADRARSRARARRRTRSRVVVGAVVLAVVAAVVPLALLGGAESRLPAVAATQGWRTVELQVGVDAKAGGGGGQTVLVDVPRAWNGAGDEQEGVHPIDETGTQDFTFGPGLRAAADYDYPVGAAWSGYVTVGDRDGVAGYVAVDSDDRQVALRVLGSVRSPGQSLPDLSGEWPDTATRGIAVTAPRLADGADLGLDVRRTDERGSGAEVVQSQEIARDRWRARVVTGGLVVRVIAPTRALAELVAASAVPLEQVDGVEEGWRTVEVDGILLDLPDHWVRLDVTGCSALAVDVDGARFGPAGTAPCARAVPVEVFGIRSLQAGALRAPGFTSPPGLVSTGEQVVLARGDLGTRRRVLASARLEGEDPGDLAAPWEEVVRDGATWQQPATSDVPGVVVTPLDAGLRCRDVDRAPATPTGDGRWRGTYCLDDRAATVTAPTQALADLVGSTVRSG